ncbi:Tyrosine kinase domain protein [Ceratobasidium sp. AG-Ba]|nr:Tyrosine kinase domain protein [Ceratobasidium sp. AG-Ba]
MSQAIVSEHEVIGALRAHSVRAISDVQRDLGFCPSQTHGQVLSLYRSATLSEPEYPSLTINIPGSAPKILYSDTCPPSFSPFFESWALLVPRIHRLSQKQKNELQQLICDQPTIVSDSGSPAPPSYSSLYSDDIRGITTSLLELSNRIQDWQANVEGPSQQARNTQDFHSSPPILPQPPEYSTQSNSRRNYPRSPPTGFNFENNTAQHLMLGTHNFERTLSDGLSSLNEPESIIADVISSRMRVSDIIRCLAKHGCTDRTRDLDHDSAPRFPQRCGGNSDVYEGKLHGGESVAIKVLRLAATDQPERRSSNSAARELYIWSKCNHPYVVPFLGLVDFRGAIAMLSPWMENGDLSSYINKHPGVNRLDLSIQIADALAYLHSKSIVNKVYAIREGISADLTLGKVHGDIKGPNILISKEGSVGLIDFGSAALGICTLQFTDNSKNRGWTARWTAPEIFLGGNHTPEGDVYALGMTILETFTGKVPYFGKHEPAVCYALALKEKPSRPVLDLPEWNEYIWSLMQNCWSEDPEKRPTSSQVLSSLKEQFQAARVTATTIPLGTNEIGVDTPISEIIAQLCDHGCRNLTNELDPSSISIRPVRNGGFGQVYRARLKGSTDIALKILGIHGRNEVKHLKHAAHELYAWSKCSHPNVTPLLGLAEFDGRIGMVSPWMKNGDLRHYLAENIAVDRLDLCSQIASAMAYLHSVNIVHGALKGSDVLVSDDGIPVLIDFGNAILSEYTLQFTQTTTKPDMNIRWTAPELMNDEKPSYKSDVYALGMTILVSSMIALTRKLIKGLCRKSLLKESRTTGYVTP